MFSKLIAETFGIFSFANCDHVVVHYHTTRFPIVFDFTSGLVWSVVSVASALFAHPNLPPRIFERQEDG
jgi:hypothetical protein